MAISWSGVEWDKGNRTKCQKHGVSIDDIEHVLLRGPSFVMPDQGHSITEQRHAVFGRTGTGRGVYIVFTLRITSDGKIYIRQISARFMHRREIEHYEKEIAERR
jgi:uncharacterized protein